MRLRTLTIVFILNTAGVFAGSASIGMITSGGAMSLNRSEVWGNATLFDGSAIETRKASGDAALTSGVRIQFAAESKATVWKSKTSLDQGTAQLAARTPYEIDAGGIKVKAESGSRLMLKTGARVEVTAMAGMAQVRDRDGTLLASIAPGRTLSFAFQAMVTHTGCLVYKDGHFLVQDENSSQVIEVTGANLAANTGNRVEVTGTPGTGAPTVANATSTMDVSAVATKTAGGCLSVAASLNAQTEAPPGATAQTPSTPSGGNTPASTPKTGMSTGAKIAIVAAVGGGGAGAALALAGKKSSTSP